MFQPREDKRKYRPVSSFSKILEDGIREWLTIANVEIPNSGSCYSYSINDWEYKSPYYHFCNLEDCCYGYKGKEGCDNFPKNVEPDRDSIPKTIYAHTYNFMDGLPDDLIKRLDAIITKGDLPGKGSFGVSSWLRKKDNIIPEDRVITFWMSYLKSFIPVVVVDKRTMKKHDLPENEILALYLSKSELFAGPCIAICKERIMETAEDLEIPFEDLCIIVLLQQLAYAIMDSTIVFYEEEDNKFKLEKKAEVELEVFKKNSFAKKYRFALEEFLANMIMLRYCQLQEDSNLFEIAKVFVGKQSPNYKFVLEKFEAIKDQIYWSKWRKAKSGNLGINPNGLEDWYNTFFDKEDVEGMVSVYNDIFVNTEEENSKED